MKIEFIIPTYNRPHHLMTVISSIFAQTNPNWSIHVVADCPPEGSLDKIMEFYKDSDKIRFTILDERHNDWGHTPRNYGLKNAKEEWIVMTGEDNYYAPIFVDEFLKSVTPKIVMVYSDMVHNWVKNEYIAVKTKPIPRNIDIGCYMFKKRISQGMELDPSNEEADGQFLVEYLQQCPLGKLKHIEKFIYVHN